MTLIEVNLNSRNSDNFFILYVINEENTQIFRISIILYAQVREKYMILRIYSK